MGIPGKPVISAVLDSANDLVGACLATFRPPMMLLTVVLIGLLALLATLQYKWLGQVSEADRERRHASLNAGATEFAQDLDRELTRAYLLFQAEPVRMRSSRHVSRRATTSGRPRRDFRSFSRTSTFSHEVTRRNRNFAVSILSLVHSQQPSGQPPWLTGAGSLSTLM